MGSKVLMLALAGMLAGASYGAVQLANGAQYVLASAAMYLVAATGVMFAAGAVYAAFGGDERAERVREARRQDRRDRRRVTSPSAALQRRGARPRERFGPAARELD